MCRIKIDNQIHTIQFLTIQQFRWILWAERYLRPNGVRLNSKALRPYALAVSNYLHAVDTGNLTVTPPVATSYSLTASIDLYEVLPEFIIDGYDNFMGFMHRYREINADFADGVLAFVAGDSLIEWFKANAPDEAFPNKGRVMLQHEYREFFNLKGSVREVNGLTTSGFDTLSTGSYIFSVGIDGSVRIAKDLSVSAMKTIENEIDQKLPRVNHAFLFPVEPILCAGTFTVETDSVPRIVKINAESGHYYYCNLTPTIREDISIKSDHYILTLGHFFKALDEMGIFYKGALISKF